MRETYRERLRLWKERLVQNLAKSWWGLITLFVAWFVCQMLLSRLLDAANHLVDNHGWTLLRPVVTFLMSVAEPFSILRALTWAGSVCMVVFFGLVIHAYWETRPARGLADIGPHLHLEFLDTLATNSLDHSGLVISNGGQSDGLNVRLTSAFSNEPVRLIFEDLPIQRIAPGDTKRIRLRTECLLPSTGRWCPIGGTQSGQLEGCFQRLDQISEIAQIPVKIEYEDHTREKHQKKVLIKHDDSLGSTKRMWCEPT